MFPKLGGSLWFFYRDLEALPACSARSCTFAKVICAPICPLMVLLANGCCSEIGRFRAFMLRQDPAVATSSSFNWANLDATSIRALFPIEVSPEMVMVGPCN
jgi:hypothetical protein